MAVLCTFVSPFCFPLALTVVCIGLSALAFPPLALLGGVLLDALYYVPAVGHFPLGTLVGMAGFVLAFLVQKFVRARIMGA